MKKIIKAIILRLPIISTIYLRYRSIEDRLYKQKKSIEKLKDTNKKQSETIKVLRKEVAEKDKKINKLSKSVTEAENKLKEQISQQMTEQKNHIAELEKTVDGHVDSLKKEISGIRNEADEKLREEKDRNDELNRKLNEQLSREIFRTNTHLKNMDKDLKAKISYKYIQGLHKDDYKRVLTEWLYESVGEVGDLDNPRTFNEKIQWIKLNSENELYTRLADKYLVREWVAEKIGEEYLIPLIGAWDNFDDINFDEFPDKFVLKANHGCRYNYIVYDKNEFNQADAKNKFTKWMRENFAWNSLELQYNNIPRKIIAEEYMENSEKNLNDYKIFCFNGKPKYIMFLTDRAESLKMAIFDLEWNLMPFTYNFPQYTGEVEKPAQLDELIKLAGILAEGFPHVRVDFYVLNDGSIRFGEMTFTTSSGFCRFDPPEYNRILGDMITLPIENQ